MEDTGYERRTLEHLQCLRQECLYTRTSDWLEVSDHQRELSPNLMDEGLQWTRKHQTYPMENLEDHEASSEATESNEIQ